MLPIGKFRLAPSLLCQAPLKPCVAIVGYGGCNRKIGGEVAEGVGFEPTEPLGSTVFKTAAIDHSATLPVERTHNALSTGGPEERTGFPTLPALSFGPRIQ